MIYLCRKYAKRTLEKKNKMTAGRPPKPTELKRLLGNPGQRPLPDLNNITHLPMAREIPAPPETLGEAGTKLWNRAWGMAVTWLSPVSDIDAISNASFLADASEAARNKYMATLEAADGRAFVAINKAYTDALASLGFDPIARSRLGVAEVKAATSIDKLLERRHNRANADTIIVEAESEIVEQGESINNEASSN
jgi:phage terminase small subunit